LQEEHDEIQARNRENAERLERESQERIKAFKNKKVEQKLAEVAREESEIIEKKVKYEKIRNKTMDKTKDNLKNSSDEVNSRKFKDVYIWINNE
jgi:hypothetical protein